MLRYASLLLIAAAMALPCAAASQPVGLAMGANGDRASSSLRLQTTRSAVRQASAIVAAQQSAAPPRSMAAASDPLRSFLPGRELDARVAAIAFRLVVAGQARCPVPAFQGGVLLQHLSQFERADRPGMVAALSLDRGPAVIVVVPGGPAAAAGVRPGDVLTAVDGAPLPAEPDLAAPFDADRAHARADMVDRLLARSGGRTLTLWRDGATVTVRLYPSPACPSLVRLARSGQRNAYADGTHVFVTTGIVDRMANDDELAFVLAHEIAHNILGHAAVMRAGEVRRGLGRTLGRSGAIVRATEAEADALAGALMLDAGYDPVRGAEALRRIDGASLGIGLFAAHAPTGERIAAMRALVAARGPR